MLQNHDLGLAGSESSLLTVEMENLRPRGGKYVPVTEIWAALTQMYFISGE